jgi:hypothetical protein
MGQHLDALAARLALRKAMREVDRVPLRVVKSRLRREIAEAIILDLKIPVLSHTLQTVIWLVFRHRKLNVVTSFADHDGKNDFSDMPLVYISLPMRLALPGALLLTERARNIISEFYR